MHRMLRSIVFGSAFLLEGVGCTVSHPGRPPAPPPPEPDGGPPGVASRDAGSGDAETRDAALFDDAGELRDAEARWEAWRDAAAPDAAAPDAAAPDAAAPDALPPCDEIGWPTTKGYWCVLENDRELCGGSASTEPTCQKDPS